jgi:hypothetical protein
VAGFLQAGNDEHDCMEISGHQTRAIFDRYDIIDEDDQRRTLERQQECKRQLIERAESDPGSAGWMNYHKRSTKPLFS